MVEFYERNGINLVIRFRKNLGICRCNLNFIWGNYREKNISYVCVITYGINYEIEYMVKENIIYSYRNGS